MAAGCGGASTSATGLTPAFAKVAMDARRYMSSDLIPGVGTARFPVVYAASRAKVRIAESEVKSDTDQGVWLLLTMVNVKSNELNGSKEMAAEMDLSAQARRGMREAAQDVTEERFQCMSEADGWLSGKSSMVSSLKKRPCLQQAKLALAVLRK